MMTTTQKRQLTKTIKVLKPQTLELSRTYGTTTEHYTFKFCYACEDGDAIVSDADATYYGHIKDLVSYLSCCNFDIEYINAQLLILEVNV